MLRIHVLGGLYVSGEQRLVTGAAAQPRRLAVLALLTVAGDRGLSRDQLQASLWPDSDAERGRHALTQSLYGLRRDLSSDDLFLGQKEIRLNPDLIGSDYADFRAALRTGDPARAAELYRGEFLEGFHLPGVDTFERWVEEHRSALAHEYGQVLETAARRAMATHDYLAAVGFLRKRATQDPLNPRVAVKLMEALAAEGDLVSALQYARIHSTLVKQELDLPPDREIVELAERLRRLANGAGVPARVEVVRQARAPVESAPALTGPPAAAAILEPQPLIAPEHNPEARRMRFSAPVALVAVLIATLLLVLLYRPPPAREPPTTVVAIGTIVHYGAQPQDEMDPPLAEMLATNLARSSGFRVISTGRMLELVQHRAGSSDSAGSMAAAARQARATELIEGVLYTMGAHRFRLDLRRVDLASGALIRGYRLEGTDLFSLVDSSTAELAADLGGQTPAGPLSEVSTTSVKAYQLYEQGLVMYYRQQTAAAERLFREALEADPNFAQAALYYARSTTSNSQTETLDRLERAVRLAQHASDRERLIIEGAWAAANSSPSLLAIADTLTIRYPEEVDGYYYAAEAAMLNGEYLKAVAPFRKIIALNPPSLYSPGLRCRTCEGYGGLSEVYYSIDSTTLMRSVLREWVRLMPTAAPGWRSMAEVYVAENRPDSAMIALRRADSLDPGSEGGRRQLISVRLHLRDYAGAEQLLRSSMATGPLNERRQAGWDLAVVLRQVGRLREALPLAHDYRMDIRERLRPGAAPFNALLEGQVLFELGRYAAAASLFDSISVGQLDALDSNGQARDRIWAWAHEADALAAMRDTSRLRVLADSMEVMGHGLLRARERNLYAHARGLLARIRGDDEDAEDWFRRAMVSPVVGLTRTNYELAGIYLRTGRPREAIRVLGSAIRAGTDGPNLYITRPELEKREAEAFEAAGMRDSAAAYYRVVVKAWERADPEFAARRDSVQAALAKVTSLH